MFILTKKQSTSMLVLLVTTLVINLGCANIEPQSEANSLSTSQEPSTKHETQSSTKEIQSGLVVFINDNMLWVMDESGQNPQTVADCSITRCADALSWDGQRFVYAERKKDEAKTTYSLGVINLDGTQKTELVKGLTGWVVNTGWSFDDNYIAFTVSGYKESETLKEEIDWWELYTIDLTNGQVNRIAEGKMTFIWSPAENRLAVLNRYGTIGKYGLYVMNLEGSEQQKVFVESKLIDFYDWAPDGKRLAFSGQGSSDNNLLSIFLVDTDGQNLEELTVNEEYWYKLANRPHWSPDGRWVAYIADYQPEGQAEGKSELATLFVADLELDIQQPLVNNVARQKIFWSPDSSKILYQSNEDKAWYIVSVNDGTIKKFANVEDIGEVLRWD